MLSSIQPCLPLAPVILRTAAEGASSKLNLIMWLPLFQTCQWPSRKNPRISMSSKALPRLALGMSLKLSSNTPHPPPTNVVQVTLTFPSFKYIMFFFTWEFFENAVPPLEALAPLLTFRFGLVPLLRKVFSDLQPEVRFLCSCFHSKASFL